MTSREIIIDLIDKDKITGEEAYVLLNDIFKAEMVAVNETLKEVNRNSTPFFDPNYWQTIQCTSPSISSTTTYSPDIGTTASST